MRLRRYVKPEVKVQVKSTQCKLAEPASSHWPEWSADDAQQIPYRPLIGAKPQTVTREGGGSEMSAGAAEAGFDEWCGQCRRTTRQMDTPDGPKRCPACHPLAGQHLGQFRSCPACLALIPRWDREPCGSHKPVPERERRAS